MESLLKLFKNDINSVVLSLPEVVTIHCTATQSRAANPIDAVASSCKSSQSPSVAAAIRLTIGFKGFVGIWTVTFAIDAVG